MGVYVNYMTGGLDPSQPLNVFGSLDTGDKAALAQAFGELLTSMDLTCAWQVCMLPPTHTSSTNRCTGRNHLNKRVPQLYY